MTPFREKKRKQRQLPQSSLKSSDFAWDEAGRDEKEIEKKRREEQKQTAQTAATIPAGRWPLKSRNSAGRGTYEN